MLTVTLSWGACFLLISWGLRDAPVLWFAALRSLLAGAVLLPLCVTRRPMHPCGVRAWGFVAVLGVVNAGLAFAAMFAGVAGGANGTAAVLANAQPLLIVLPAWWLYGESLDRRVGGALVAAFTGLVIVAVPGGGGRGAWLSLGAAVAITSGTLLARKADGFDVVVVTAWHFLLGGAALVVVAAIVEGAPRIDWTVRFSIVLAALAALGTAMPFLLWFHELRRCRLGDLAAWTFLVPVIGAVLAVLVLGERLGMWTMTGIVLVLSGVWFALHPRRRP
jgi:probable blue pigment (indigoidine) exporter